MAPRRGEGFLGGSYPYYAIYETRDDKLLTIGCTEPWLWENFCKAIGRPDFARFARKPDQFVRAANAEEAAARDAIEAVIRTRDRDDWYEFLVKHDVCVGKVYEIEEMVRDPQINHRGMIVDVEHPTHGRVRQFGMAIKLSETPGTIRTAAPLGRRAHRGHPEGPRPGRRRDRRACASARSSSSATGAVIAERWRQLALLSLAELLALSLWFSASAVLPALRPRVGARATPARRPHHRRAGSASSSARWSPRSPTCPTSGRPAV